MIGRLLKLLFGMDPILLDAEKRVKRLEATINGEAEWMLVCKPLQEGEEEIQCNNGEDYYRKQREG